MSNPTPLLSYSRFLEILFTQVLKNLQGWRLHNVSGEPVLLFSHSYSDIVKKKILKIFMFKQYFLYFSLCPRTPKSSSTKLLSSCWVPSQYSCMGLLLLGCRNLHFPLLGFTRFLLAHFSRLSRSLRVACQPCLPGLYHLQTF